MLRFLRLFLVVIWFFGATSAILLIALARPFSLKNALLWCAVIPPISRKILGFDYEVRNHERLTNNHPSIIIANHQHALDLIIFGETLNVPTTAIGKKELAWIPFFGWLFWLSGQVMIDRGHRKKAVDKMNFAKNEVDKSGASVWVFPEGTRSAGKGLGSFKKGAFYLAIQTKRPLLPVVANSFHKSINFNKWNSGKIVVEYLEPIPTVDWTEKNIDALIEKSHQKIAQAIERLDVEVKK